MASPDPRARFVGLTLAVGLPAAVHLAAASPAGGFGEAGFTVGAAPDLGIVPPPGAPVPTLLFALFRLLPFGPAPLRLALVSTLLVALAAAAQHRLACAVLAAQPGLRASRVLPLAVASTWAFAFSGAAFAAATEPSLAAPVACLALLFVERLVHLETVVPSTDDRALPTLGLLFGLALASHHVLGMLLLPLAMPTLARAVSVHGARRLLGVAWLTLVGLAAYALLPLRAHGDPMLEVGHPDSLVRLLWVLVGAPLGASAGAPELASERLATALAFLADALSPAGLALAALAAVAWVRAPAVRRVGVVLALATALPPLALVWLRAADGTDIAAALLPAVGVGAVLALSALGQLCERALPEGRVHDAAHAAACLVGAAALLLPAVLPLRTRGLALVADLDALDDGLRRDLPRGALVFVHTPSTYARLVAGEAEEHTRPDVTLVPVPFLAYPHAMDALAAADPALAPMLRAYALEGRLTLPELQTLANDRPVLLEFSPTLHGGVRRALAPSGLYYELLPGGTTDGDEGEGRHRTKQALVRLGRALDPLREPRTRALLVAWLADAATYYADFGDLTSARACLATASGLAPEDTRLRDARPLLDGAERTVDLRPALFPGLALGPADLADGP